MSEKKLLPLNESCLIEVDRVNCDSDMFHVIKTLTNLWRRGLIRNNYFPLIFVCYIKQLFTALMMLSSKRSIFSLSKRCYGNLKIWMSCTSRLWKIKRRNLCCCVDFYFIQASHQTTLGSLRYVIVAFFIALQNH